MIIYNHDNTELLNIEIDDRSYRFREVQGPNEVTLYYSLPQHVEVPVGSYVVVNEERYTLLKSINFSMIHTEKYEYTITLHSKQELMNLCMVVNNVDGRIEFTMTAKPHEHLDLIVLNLKRKYPHIDWSVGKYPDGKEITLAYSSTYCFDALKQLAENLNDEFYINGSTINIGRFVLDDVPSLELSYGEGNGVMSGLERSSGNEYPIGKLYVKLGDRNIDKKSYGHKTLRLPKDKEISLNGTRYKTDAEGLYIERIGATNTEYLREETLDLTNVYPHRVGEVSDVEVIQKEIGDLYDIIDTSIPDELNYEDYLIEGEEMNIKFETGMLAGKEFGVSYKHEDRKFLIVPQEIDGVMMPSDAFIPKKGDKYGIFGCKLPDYYNTLAEEEALDKSVEHYDKNKDDKLSFKFELDSIWSKKNWLNIQKQIRLGAFVEFTNPEWQKEPISIRIISIKEYLNDPYAPELQLSNSIPSPSLTDRIREYKQEPILRKEADRINREYTLRRFRDALETMKMLEGSVQGFTEGISPITVQTMQILAGSNVLQFRFVDSKKRPIPVDLDIRNNKDGTITLGKSILQHMTLGISNMKPLHKPAEYRFWDLDTYISKRLDVDKGYYIYAKANKTSQTANWVISESIIDIDKEAGYYNFLVGILNKAFDEKGRSFAKVYGFTEITPGQIKTELISSEDGKSFWNLLSGRFQTKKDFIIGNPDSTSGEPCLAFIDGKLFLRGMMITIGDKDTSIEDALIAKDEEIKKERQEREKSEAEYKRKLEKAREDLQKAIDNLQNASEQDNADLMALIQKVNSTLNNLQKQVDNEVSNWFYPSAPSPSKAPEKNWTTNNQKVAHVGDTYTSTDKEGEFMGKSWRYMPSFTWQEIHDTLVSKALHLASQAQSTADGKSTTYLTKPSSYNKGDAWKLESDYTLNGKDYKKDTILYATQESPSFVGSHWVESRYIGIDDFEIGGRNLALKTYDGVTDVATGKANQIVDPKHETINFVDYGMLPTDKITHSWRWRVESLTGDGISGNLYSRPKTILKDGTTSFNFFNTSRIVFSDDNKEGLFFETFSVGEVAEVERFMYRLDAPNHIKLTIYQVKLEKGNKATDWSEAPEDIEARRAKEIEAVNTSISEANKATTDLNEYIDGAFRDGLISDTESVAIEKLINLVESQKAGLEATYSKLYANSYLKGTAKSSLLNAKVSYFGAVENVLNSINSAIGDGKATKAEKQDVERKFSAYNVALADFQNAVEQANRAIQVEIERIAKGYTDDKVAKTIISTDVEYYLSTSRTELAGGKWQTIAPDWQEGRYMWSRTRVVLKDGTTKYTPDEGGTCIAGATGATGVGEKGKDGTKIVSITEEFYLSTSKEDPVGGEWLTTPPAWEMGKYIWTRSRIKYENPTSEETTTPLVSSEWEAINDIEIGSRNYYIGSSAEWETVSFSSWYSKPIKSIIDLEDNSRYTFGFDLKHNSDDELFHALAYVYDSDGNSTSYSGDYDRTSLTQFVTFTTPSNFSRVALHVRSGVKDGVKTAKYRRMRLFKGDKLLDWVEAPEDIKAKIDSAIISADDATKDLKTYVDGAFRDGVIDETEAVAIEKSINIVETEWESILSRYNQVFSQELANSQSLLHAKINCKQAVDNLLKSINSAIQDGKATTEEVLQVNNRYSEYKYAFADFSKQLELATTSKISTIKDGLSNANTLITSLETITKELKEGKLDASKFDDIRYLTDALQHGETTIAGGLILTKSILMSNVSGGITTAISGYNEGGGVAFEAGIKNYKQENHTSRVVINHDGTARFGDMYVNTEDEDVVKFIDQSSGKNHEYLKFGGTAPSESYMNDQSTEIKEFPMPSARAKNRSGSFIIGREYESIESNREIRHEFELTATAEAVAIREDFNNGGPSVMSATQSDYGPGSNKGDKVITYLPAWANSTAHVEVKVYNKSGVVVWSDTSTKVTASAHARGGSVSLKDILPLEDIHDVQTHTEKVHMRIPANVMVKGYKWRVYLVISGSATHGGSSYEAHTKNGKEFVPYDKSKPFVAIAKDKVAFFFGRQRQILLNYASDWLMKIIGNVLVQGSVKADIIEAGEWRGSGAVLAGAMFNASGVEQAGFGKYKNRVGYNTAYAGYSYSTEIYTVYHSIGHTNYVPIVQVTGINENKRWNIATRIYDIDRNSFTVGLITNNDNYTKNGFSYVCYNAE